MAIFKPGKCHHRNAEGQPDCGRAKVKPWANLCREHEAEYRAGRYRARMTAFGRSALSRRPRATTTEADGSPRKRRTDRNAKKAATSPPRRRAVPA